VADPSETTQVAHEPAREGDDLVAAVRALTAEVGSLKEDVHALRAEARSLPSGDDRPGWDETVPAPLREGSAWVRAVDSPLARGLAVPWLLLEILFLVAIAALCVVAGFDVPVIVGAMGLAWALVAAGEWLVSRAERERHRLTYGATAEIPASVPDDRAWFASNGDDTLLDAPSSERPPARLPPPE
jgi:hypothetical protein